MQNNLYQSSPTYKRGDKRDAATLGGLNKTSRIIRANEQREAVEAQFLRISLKANRADKQREERRNKRKN
jgi:hypothetical protein